MQLQVISVGGGLQKRHQLLCAADTDTQHLILQDAAANNACKRKNHTPDPQFTGMQTGGSGIIQSFHRVSPLWIRGQDCHAPSRKLQGASLQGDFATLGGQAGCQNPI